MKPWTVGVAAAILFIAKSVCAQESRPVAFEVGVVQGILPTPYASVGVVAGPWSVRVSGGASGDGRNGQQLNVGRVVRQVDEGNAKHTVGVVWARVHNAYQYGFWGNRSISGQYFGLAYDFQVKGFFIEAGPAFGMKNPWSPGTPLTHVYGQIGYVYRFGKTYED